MHTFRKIAENQKLNNSLLSSSSNSIAACVTDKCTGIHSTNKGEVHVGLRTTKAKQVHTTLTAKTGAGQFVAIWKTTDNGEINLCQEQTVRMLNYLFLTTITIDIFDIKSINHIVVS